MPVDQNLNTNATVSIALPPVVNATGANAGNTTAVLNGSVSQLAPGSSSVTVGFEYWPDNNPYIITTVPVGSVSTLNGTFSAAVSGLSAGTKYDYAATGVGFFTVSSVSSSFTTNSTLAVTTSSLPEDTTGIPYNQTLQATGGSGGYTGWSISTGSLPPGLSLSSGGVISGTPTSAGTYSFTATVTDSTTATAGASLSIYIIAAASKLVFAQNPTNALAGAFINPAVTVNIEDANNQIVTTSSAVVSLSITGSPSGVNLSGLQTVNAVNGVATFQYLNINKVGYLYFNGRQFRIEQRGQHFLYHRHRCGQTIEHRDPGEWQRHRHPGSEPDCR